MGRILVGLAAVFGVCVSQGYAASMEEVVVTGTRLEESIYEVPQAVSQLDREEIIENAYRTTPESLMEMTGVMVQKTAHGHGSPFIRGLTGKQVLILVDGIRFNNSIFRFGPNQYLNTIDPANIDHIEVIRGPGSVLYGSDALGGVINIVTRKRKDFSSAKANDTEVNLMYGSADNERTVRAATEGNISDYGYFYNADQRSFDDLEGGGDIGRQFYTAYDEMHFNTTQSFKLTENERIDVSLQYTRQNDLPRTDKFINSNEQRYYDPQAYTLLSMSWDKPLNLSWAQRMQTKLSYQLMEERLTRQKFGSTKLRVNDDKVHTLGLAMQFDFTSLDDHVLTYGFEYYQDTVKSSRVDTDIGTVTIKGGTFPDNSKYSTAGIYIQDEYFWSGVSTLTTGLRYSRNEAKSNLVSFGLLDETYDDVTASLRMSSEIISGMRLFGGISQGFRAPNLDDVAVLTSTNEGTDVPSPGLKPEESLNYEIGLKFNQPNWQGTFVAYWSDFSNLIDRRPGTYLGLTFIDDNNNGIQDAGEENVVQKFNVGNAHIWGLEMDGRYKLNSSVSLFGSLAYAYGENETSNEPISRIPPLTIRVGGRWQPSGKSWWLEPFVEKVDDQDRLSSRDVSDPRIPVTGTPGYTTWNVRGGWKDKVQSVSVAFNNITDRAYKVHGSGVYGPGREIKINYLRKF